jgi:hypothetical protein
MPPAVENSRTSRLLTEAPEGALSVMTAVLEVEPGGLMLNW